MYESNQSIFREGLLNLLEIKDSDIRILTLQQAHDAIDKSIIAIPAGVLIGLGVGFLIDNIPAGIFLGLGGGFLVMMIGMMILWVKR